MKGYEDLEKALKSQAESILPGDDFKDALKARMFDNAKKSASVKNKAEKASDMDGDLSFDKQKKSDSPTLKERIRHLPKRIVYSAVAACLVVCLSLGLGLGLGLNGNDEVVLGDTYIAMDINPSFGIVADADGTVKEVTALNKDAALVVYGESFVGRQADDVCACLAELSYDLGYLPENGKINVTACNDNAELQSSISAAINAKISGNETLTAINATVNIISGGKSALLTAATNARIQIDNADGLTPEQINELLNGYDKEELDSYANALSAEIAAEIVELRTAAQNLLNAIATYNESFSVAAGLEVIGYGLKCAELYEIHTGVTLSITNLKEYVAGFTAYVNSIANADNATIEAEIRVELKSDWKADNNSRK